MFFGVVFILYYLHLSAGNGLFQLITYIFWDFCLLLELKRGSLIVLELSKFWFCKS